MSGWKEQIAKNISGKLLFFSFCIWYASRLISFQWAYIQINLSYILLGLVIGMLLLKIKHHFLQNLHLIFLGGMMATFHYLLLELYSVNPMMAVTNPSLDSAIALAFIVIGLTRNLLRQTILLSVALWAGELGYAYSHRMVTEPLLGDPRFWDKWWVAIVLARLGALFILSLTLAYRRAARLWSGLTKKN